MWVTLVNCVSGRAEPPCRKSARACTGLATLLAGCTLTLACSSTDSCVQKTYYQGRLIWESCYQDVSTSDCPKPGEFHEGDSCDDLGYGYRCGDGTWTKGISDCP